MQVFLLIAILLSALYFGIIFYYRFAFTSIKLRKQTDDKNTVTPNSKSQIPNSTTLTKLSIIIPARNEAANIENCINSILANNYPTHLLEIIVVDDHSEDETASLVKKYESQNVKIGRAHV